MLRLDHSKNDPEIKRVADALSTKMVEDRDRIGLDKFLADRDHNLSVNYISGLTFAAVKYGNGETFSAPYLIFMKDNIFAGPRICVPQPEHDTQEKFIEAAKEEAKRYGATQMVVLCEISFETRMKEEMTNSVFSKFVPTVLKGFMIAGYTEKGKRMIHMFENIGDEHAEYYSWSIFSGDKLKAHMSDAYEKVLAP